MAISMLFSLLFLYFLLYYLQLLYQDFTKNCWWRLFHIQCRKNHYANGMVLGQCSQLLTQMLSYRYLIWPSNYPLHKWHG